MNIHCLPVVLNNLCAEYLNLVEFIYYFDNWNRFSPNEICTIVAKYGWVDLLDWAICEQYIQKEDLNNSIPENDAMNTQLNIDALLNRLPLSLLRQSQGIWYYAALNGYLNVLKYGYKNKFFWNDYLDVLKYGYKNGRFWYESILNVAARNGHEHIVEWLRSSLKKDGIIITKDDTFVN